MSRNLGKHDEGTGDYVFVELITRIPSHCIEVCYKRRRKTMKLRSYAVYGDHRYVSHAATEHNRKQYGIDLAPLLKLEHERNPDLPIHVL
jgi:hypothetical protein